MPTSQRPATFPGSAPSPRAPFSEHHPFPITFFPPQKDQKFFQSHAPSDCRPGAHEPAPPLSTPPHLHHLSAASPHQAEPPRLRGCKPGPSLRPRSPARHSGGRRPGPSGAQTTRAEAGAPGSGRPRVGAGAGRRVSPPPLAACRPGSRNRGRDQARSGPHPGLPSPGSRRLSPRRRGSGLAFPLAVQRWLRRRRRALLTRSSTTPDRLLKSGRVVARPLAVPLASAFPTRTSRCDWLARRLFSTSCPDWPVLSLAPPYREESSPPPPRFGLPPSPTPFPSRLAGGGSRRGVGSGERELPMGAPREGWEAGSAAGRSTGASSTNGRAPHIPGSGAPAWPLGFRRVAPRASPGWLVAREGYPLVRWENAARRRGRPRAAIVACSCSAYVESGAGSVRGDPGLCTPGTAAGCFLGRKPSVRLVHRREPVVPR